MGGSEKELKLVVHAIHGTWPYGLWAQISGKGPRNIEDEARPWFLRGSSFQLELANLTPRPLEWVPFEWSGKNSFSARAAAAKAFSQHLIDWFQREPQADHVVIAHSHGGSVAVAAARILDAHNRNRLTKIIALATPFAQERPSQRDIRHLAVRYLTLRFGWVAILLFCVALFIAPEAPSGEPLFVWLLMPTTVIPVFGTYIILFFFAIPIFLLLWRLGILKFTPPLSGLTSASSGMQGWSLYAIRAPQDEATIAINTSQFIELVSDLLIMRCLLAPFDWITARLIYDSWTKRLRNWLLIAVVIVIIMAMELGFPATDPLSLIGVIAVSLASIFQWLLIALAFIALVSSLILGPANAVLAIALGLDVLRNYGVMEMECEPIPSGITGTVSTVTLSENERSQLSLVHYIHATHAARSRVAEILKQPEGTPTLIR